MKLVFFFGLMLSGAVIAAPISATRYIDAQGIEVIHNRGAEAAVAAASNADVSQAAGKVRSVDPVPVVRSKKPTSSDILYDSKLRVSAAEQGQRDRDRVGILEQELDAEARKYDAVVKRAQGGTAPNKPSAADAQRINEELYDHQKNIQALNVELRRARAPR